MIANRTNTYHVNVVYLPIDHALIRRQRTCGSGVFASTSYEHHIDPNLAYHHACRVSLYIRRAMSSDLQKRLRQALCNLPANFQNRYNRKAHLSLLDILFRCLTNDRPDYYSELFPTGVPESGSLKDAQSALEEPEYTEAARGQPCGHILKLGEATYNCSTCTDDPTCVLCARCWVATDHEGHSFDISLSTGNGGCCDCGDIEAWKRPVICSIHASRSNKQDQGPAPPVLPADLAQATRITIGTALNYICDVISCSPESLRAQKTLQSVEQDELKSRLKSDVYDAQDQVVDNPEYSLVIWNDEKHTMDEVREQVKKACRQTKRFGDQKANEANDIGRSIIKHSSNLEELLRQAKIIEQIKVTTTIRSARDTFREQMCGTILDWLNDIAGCLIHGHPSHLREAICEEMLQIWSIGSEAWNAKIGREGLDDHGGNDLFYDRDQIREIVQRQLLVPDSDDDDEDDGNLRAELEDDDDLIQHDNVEEEEDGFEQVDSQTVDSMLEQDMRRNEIISDVDEMDTDGDNDFLDAAEQMDADRPNPVPVQQNTQPMDNEPTIAVANDVLSGQASMTLSLDDTPNFGHIPRTPGVFLNPDRRSRWQDLAHWRSPANPKAKNIDSLVPVWENIRKNIRLDALILFDLRLWKSMREQLRELLISTMVKSPQSKRILGLRFAGLYTSLAQLYLIADREPDHSIIHLSVQILTTPSIAEESVRKADFLSNLMAIVYTFLTTKQVGYPDQVDLDASVGFDAGSAANRRLYHIFHDLEMFLRAPAIQDNVRTDHRYLAQFLDLAKLCQGICPNTRAVGEHVEYEADTWISASLLMREINKLCRQFTKGFANSVNRSSIDDHLKSAIEQSTVATILWCSGLDEQRRDQSEVKNLVNFHDVGPFPSTNQRFKTINFVVEKGTLSFHHPLHYTISWLLEHGKESRRVIEVLQSTANNLVERFIATKRDSSRVALHKLYATGEDALIAIFDYSLRVCVWLAQMRASMWVRNGLSLRHQMGQYKSVNHRDLGYQRELMLLQTAFVACDPERFLASMVDRFGLVSWVSGRFKSESGVEPLQLVDVAEDFVYLLINILSDRDSLGTSSDNPESQIAAIRKEITHILCFKPLSYTELTKSLTEQSLNHEKLQEILESMTTFKAPEALNDSGMFELKSEYLKELDPYNSHFNKNQRDEAENLYKTWMAKHTSKQVDDIVFEPKLSDINSGAYVHLCAVVHTPLFASVVYSMLAHIAGNHGSGNAITSSRAEASLQIVLHLVLIATMEDKSVEDDTRRQAFFIRNALTLRTGTEGQTVVRALHKIWLTEDFASCKGKARHILKLFSRQWPRLFAEQELEFPAARLDASSPASFDLDVEAKKKQAAERKQRIMAQMQQQQQSFMNNQGMTDWDDDDMSDTESVSPVSSDVRHWKLPNGVCIQCREETNDERFYGTFAMVIDAHLLRETPDNDADFAQEVLICPENLDETNESSRPFGVAGANVQPIRRYSPDGSESFVERTILSKGWPKGSTKKGPIASSCGHIMHYSCFQNYYESTKRRHNHQIQRCQPERLEMNEFVCPLCKALANTFLPIAYKSTTQSYPGRLQSESSYEMFTNEMLPALVMTCNSLQQEGKFEEHWQAIERNVHAQTMFNFTTTGMSAVSKAVAEHCDTPEGLSETPALSNLVQLNNIYIRLSNTLNIVTGQTRNTWELPYQYLQIIANSITSVEVGIRGRSSIGSTLVDSIASQTLSHLQVLAATLHGFAASLVMIATAPTDSTPYEYMLGMTMQRLFPGTNNESGQKESQLEVDGFSTFTELSFLFTSLQEMPLTHLLRLCLTQELIRVAIWWLKLRKRSPTSESMPKATKVSVSRDEYQSMGRFLFWLTSSLPTSASSPVPDVDEVPSLYKALRVYALAFLRKSVLLLHVAHGVDFPAPSHTAHLSELDRLLELCMLPSLHVILGNFSEATDGMPFPILVRSWIQALPSQTSEMGPLIRLMHPTPFELIGLPKYYDTLLEECVKRRCPTTGKPLVDAALCLFCGEFFCTQAWCCMTDRQRGGTNRHIEKCSAPVGAYLFIRKCNVVLLNVPEQTGQQSTFEWMRNSEIELARGAYFNAPYLTKHGETDQGLRTKRQLILNQKRYDKLVRDVWLAMNGSIWSAIARKLESDFSAGGWETL